MSYVPEGRWLYYLAGAASLATAMYQLRRTSPIISNVSTYKEVKNNISLKQLAELVKSPNINLRRSAEQLLLDHVMKNQKILTELNSLCRSKNVEDALKGATILCVLVKSVDIHNHPMERAFISTLAQLLENTSKPADHYSEGLNADRTLFDRIQKLAICGLFEVICDRVEVKDYLVQTHPEIVQCIMGIIERSRCKEVVRYGLFISHQLAVEESTKYLLLEAEGVRRIAQTVVQHHGDPILQRISLQILVIFVTQCDPDQLAAKSNLDVRGMLDVIVQQGALIPIVVCLRSEDTECTYWAIALLHEFVVNELYKQEICEVYGLLHSLSKTLSSSDASLQRLILRFTCFLCLRNDQFKAEVIKQGEILKRLPVCFASSERDVCHWALVLVHDLAFLGKSAIEKILKNGEGLMASMIGMLRNHGDSDMKRLMAETLGFFCSNEHLLLSLAPDGLMATVLTFAGQEDCELKFWASAMLLNMAMTSDNMKSEILKTGGLGILMELTIGEHDNPQISVMAAKTLSMLGHTEHSLTVHVACDMDNGRVGINDSIYHLNKPGLNILLWNTLTSTGGTPVHHNVNNSWEVNDVDLSIPHTSQDEGSLVVVAVRGPHKQAWLKALKDMLLFPEESMIPVKGRFDLQDDDQCVMICTLASGGRLAVSFLEKAPDINTQCQYPYGEVVNQRLTDIVLIPVVRIMFSTPPESVISKVNELELLEVFARHSVYKDTLISCEGFIDYLASMIFHFVQSLGNETDFLPLHVAHCLGALRTLSVLSIYENCQEQLYSRGAVMHIIMLLFHLTGNWINSVLDTAVQDNAKSDALPSLPVTEAEPFHLSDSYVWEQSPQKSTAPSTNQESVLKSSTNQQPPSTNSDTILTNTINRNNSQSNDDDLESLGGDLEKSLEDLNIVTKSKSTDSKKDKLKEYEELFSSLARFAVMILCNCSDRSSTKPSSLKTALVEGGCVHTMWSTLLCSGSVLKSRLALPVSISLANLACPRHESKVKTCVLLDRQRKTQALLIGSDELQVRNDSWTFESIRATHGVKATRTGQPKGWYYEAILKSGGIMQVGWCTGQCAFAAEKGLGVGDDKYSCSFDGERCKIWNGPITDTLDNDYGSQWSDGDIVSCLMSCTGDVSFWLRGTDMGVAFKDMDVNATWYPAVSLSTDQQVRFNMGASPFRHEPPSGFISIHDWIKAERHHQMNLSFNEHDLFVRDLLTPLDDVDNQHVPSLYYELTITDDTDLPINFGLSNINSVDSISQQVCCTVRDSELVLPDNTKAKLGPLESLPLTLGCGLILPEGRIFFTVNGRSIKPLYSFTDSAVGLQPLVPFCSTYYVDTNYGDSYFFYSPANQKECRLGMAALLHDYHEMRWIASGQAAH